MLGDITFILIDVILPVLMIAAVGALLHRKLDLDLQSLAKLNIYVFVPAFLFLYVFKSSLSFSAAADIVWLIALPSLIVGVLAWVGLKLARTDRQRMTTILIAGLIFNAGNFGIPVALLRHGEPGAEVQAIIVMISNVSIWWIGYSILAIGHKGDWKASFGFFKLPMIYALAAAIALRMAGVTELPQWIDFPVDSLAKGLIPMALIVLGAQLADRIRWPNWRIVGPVLVIKLIALPAVTDAIVYFMGYWPWPGAQIVLATAAPTAVNTLLLTMELEGDAEAAADCVAWTTLVSSITVAIALVIIAACGGQPPDLLSAIEP